MQSTKPILKMHFLRELTGAGLNFKVIVTLPNVDKKLGDELEKTFNDGNHHPQFGGHESGYAKTLGNNSGIKDANNKPALKFLVNVKVCRLKRGYSITDTVQDIIKEFKDYSIELGPESLKYLDEGIREVFKSTGLRQEKTINSENLEKMEKTINDRMAADHNEWKVNVLNKINSDRKQSNLPEIKTFDELVAQVPEKIIEIQDDPTVSVGRTYAYAEYYNVRKTIESIKSGQLRCEIDAKAYPYLATTDAKKSADSKSALPKLPTASLAFSASSAPQTQPSNYKTPSSTSSASAKGSSSSSSSSATSKLPDTRPNKFFQTPDDKEKTKITNLLKSLVTKKTFEDNRIVFADIATRMKELDKNNAITDGLNSIVEATHFPIEAQKFLNSQLKTDQQTIITKTIEAFRDQKIIQANEKDLNAAAALIRTMITGDASFLKDFLKEYYIVLQPENQRSRIQTCFHAFYESHFHVALEHVNALSATLPKNNLSKK